MSRLRFTTSVEAPLTVAFDVARALGCPWPAPLQEVESLRPFFDTYTVEGLPGRGRLTHTRRFTATADGTRVDEQIDGTTGLPGPRGVLADRLLRRRIASAMRAHLDAYAAAAAARSRDVVRVVGAALVEEGRVLVAQRSGGPYDGCWEFPGGKVDPGESDLSALVRECAEELGVTVVPEGFLGEVVLDGPVGGGAPGASTMRVWWARVASGTPVAHEHASLRWVGRDELDDLDWIAADRPLLPALRTLLTPSDPLRPPPRAVCALTARAVSAQTAGKSRDCGRRPRRRPGSRQDRAMLLRSHGLHGVFIGSHAVSEGALTVRQLRDGPYVRVLRGVYADPSLPRDHLLRCRAAALLMPPGAALACRSAATVLGAPAPGYGDPVTVVLPEGVQWRGPSGVRVRRASVPAGDVLIGEGDLPCTTPLRTAWDVASVETTATAVGVLDALVRAGVLHPAALARQLRDGAGRWGVRRVRAAFELVDGRSESPPESWVRVACALGGLPAPVPQFDVVEEGVWLGRVDLAWPDAKVVVEYEGAHHFDGIHIVRDDERYRRLVAAGWHVVRIAAHDLRDMDAVVRRIAEALAAGSATA